METAPGRGARPTSKRKCSPNMKQGENYRDLFVKRHALSTTRNRLNSDRLLAGPAGWCCAGCVLLRTETSEREE